jgi:hypothetical protein
MNRAMVLAGAALVVAGAVMLAMLLSHATTPVSPVAAPVPDLSSQSDAPSRLWPVLIGLTLAAGAGLIGIGMNRWRQTG